MNRAQLAIILRAASRVSGDDRIIVLGSQSILGVGDSETFPAAVVASIEADLAFFDDDNREKADKVTAVLDEMTPFHDLYGVYAEGVHISTAVLPRGWEGRLVFTPIEDASPARPVFLDPHDLVISKLAAGREKDFEFCSALINAGMVYCATLSERVGELPAERLRARISKWIEAQERRTQDRALTERVVCAVSPRGRSFVVKISYRKGSPHTVRELDVQKDIPEWKDAIPHTDRRVGYILGLARSMDARDRLIPRDVVRRYGEAYGRCLICSRPLTDPDSVARGHGPECARRVGPPLASMRDRTPR